MKKIVFTVVLFGASMHADILEVPTQYGTIQSAIDAASNGDSIHILSGEYNETLNTLGKAIELIGVDGAEMTTVDATGIGGSVIVCNTNETSDTLITGLTMTGGTGTLHPIWETYQGGGVFAYFASPTITDCVVIGNTAEFAGGVWAQEYFGTINNVRFEQNQSTHPKTGGAGGLYLWNSTAVVSNCLFEVVPSLGRRESSPSSKRKSASCG